MITLQTFYDYDPSHPFVITNEHQIIKNSRAVLDYTPLKGSVAITGFRETSSEYPQIGEFHIDYRDYDDYKSATQEVFFNPYDNGKHINISYRGVATIIQAKHLNEIKHFMERFNPMFAPHHETPCRHEPHQHHALAGFRDICRLFPWELVKNKRAPCPNEEHRHHAHHHHDTQSSSEDIRAISEEDIRHLF